jgi:tetratricopeptide (TPR) repeat protein
MGKTAVAKLKAFLLAVCFCAGPAIAAAPPVAGTVEDITIRLQRSIDRASERGNYRQVQALRFELAQRYAAAKAYGQAARQYELLLASRPSKRDRVSYFVELGKMRAADQNYGGAIAAFQDALHDDPRSWDANLQLARAYDHAELNSKAIEVYKRCIVLRPSAHDAYAGIGHVYQQLGFLNKAVLNYQKAIKLEKRPETFLQLSDAYVRQGNIAHAKDILQQGKASLPRVDYDVQLGKIYRREGDWRNACAAWEEALKADSKRDDVRLHLAQAYDRLGRPADSDRMFKRLLAEYPLSPLVHFSRAWVLYARGDLGGARSEALQTQQLGPSTIVGHYNDELLAQLQKKS